MVGVDQRSFARRLPVGRDGRIPLRRPSGLVRSARVVTVFIAATFTAGAAIAFSGTAETNAENDPGRYPVTILSSSDHTTVSWKVRSSGAVRLRLYRAQASDGEILVNEVVTRPGISSFEFVDENRPPGSTIYVLRALCRDGDETTIGSAQCIESKFAPCDVNSGGSSPQPGYINIRTEPTQPGMIDAEARLFFFDDGFIPGPDPPVPRWVGRR